MSHVYFSLLGSETDLNPNKYVMWRTEKGFPQEHLVPILHIESDDKDEIREELIKYIDDVLRYM